MGKKSLGTGALLAATLLLASCATLEEVVDPPQVTLRYVQAKDVDFKRQTFVLGFDVTNPNPLALPIRTVSYDIRLDGSRFASGETQGAFTIPAGGDTTFAISAELDLLKTAPQLLSIVRSAMQRDIPYELSGSLGIDLPLVRPVRFEANGYIKLSSQYLQAAD